MALLPVSLLFVIYQTSSYNFLLIGRSLAGTLYGVILITLILHIADNSSQFMRRYFIGIISIITIMPTILVAELLSKITNIRDTIESCGIIMFVLAIVTLIFMPCTYESIVFLLDNGNDLRALEILLKLRNESRHYIRHDFNEFKMMLAEDSNDCGGCNIFCDGNSRPLYLLCLLRLLNVLASGSAVYWIFLSLVWFDYHQWPFGTTNLVFKQMLVVSENVSATEIPINFSNTTDFDYYSNISLVQADSANSNWNLDPMGYSEMSNNSISAEFITNGTFPLNGTDDSWPLNQTEVSSTNSTFDYSNSFDPPNYMTSFAQHLFIQTAYSYHLPSLPIADILLIVFLIKIILGIPMMCLAEKFQIYRNRILFKITYCVGALNLIFFIGTMVCYRIDDNSLIFTFYMAKLLNLVYATYLLVTFSIETIGYSELAESFSLTKRYGSIACITIIEQLLHIIVILVIMNGQFEFYFHVVQSTIVCIFCHLLLNRMPIECLNCSLRIARDKYFVKITSADH